MLIAAIFFAAAGVINPAAHAPGVLVGLGVGAEGSNEIVVKIGGKDTRVKLARLEPGSDAVRLFLQCLVAKRVVRVDPKHGRAWMLDEVEISDSVRQFLDHPTSLEPCDAGRVAYVGPTEPLPPVQRKKGK